MKPLHNAFGLLFSAALFAGGCADTGVTRVAANDTESQVTTTGVDLADWEETAAAVTNSMIEEGIHDGATLFVQRTASVRNGEVAVVDATHANFKRLFSELASRRDALPAA